MDEPLYLSIEVNVLPLDPRRRMRKTCPLSSCGHKEVSSACFSRHLEGFHKLSKQQCEMIKHQYKTRKQYVYREERGPARQKDYHHPKKCPISGCHRYVKRLKPHLIGKLHNISNANEIKRLLSLSRGSKEIMFEQHVQKTPQTIQEMPLHSSDSGSSYSIDYEEGEAAESIESSDYSTSTERDSPNLLDEANDLRENCTMNERTIEGMLEQYYQYLISADSGNKDARSSKQHQAQLRTILQCIDDKMEIMSLIKSRLIRDIFLKGYCRRKGLGARTVKAYLQSLDHFYKFLQSEYCTVFNFDLLSSMQVRLRNWMRTYQKMASSEKHARDETEEETLLTPERIAMFENSQVCREALLILEKLKTGGVEQLTRQSFTNVRDFLMSEILIENAHRSGVLANVTMTEYYKHQLKNGLQIIKVHRHKTFGTHGVARIILSAKTFSWLEVYVQSIRPQITLLPQASDNLFVSWNGGGLTSGTDSYVFIIR